MAPKSSMLHACVQNESCTAAKVIPRSRHLSEVYFMCVESSECTKFGGNAVFCLFLFTGYSSRELTTVRFCSIVATKLFGLIYL